MAPRDCYFFFDGSTLFSQIRELQHDRGEFKGRKLLITNLVWEYRTSSELSFVIGDLHNYRRAVFYFADNDPQVDEYIVIPDKKVPDSVRDISVKYCGHRLKVPSGYDEWLSGVDPKFRQFCQKREKGVDIEICCDAMQLAAYGKLGRLILLTNDSDFIPLCEKLKEIGSNVTLIQLFSTVRVNQDLVGACDSYHVIPENRLVSIFDG